MKISVSSTKARASRFVSKPKGNDFSDAPRLFSFDVAGVKAATSEIKRLGFKAGSGDVLKDEPVKIKDGSKIVGTLKSLKDGKDKHVIIVLI